jgi:hypothetical protein
MTCAVCGRDGAGPLMLRDGTRVGLACPGECIGLLWEATWQARNPKDATAQGRALLGWEWRRQRALVGGAEFTEPAPKSAAEIESGAAFTLAQLRLDDGKPEGVSDAVVPTPHG